MLRAEILEQNISNSNVHLTKIFVIILFLITKLKRPLRSQEVKERGKAPEGIGYFSYISADGG